ncbi:MAG: outer membrane protein assembly factor BamA [Desulfobacterales bacterium]
MLNILRSIVLILVCLFFGIASAEPPPSVLVLPFAVQSTDKRPDLEAELQKIIAEHLQREGAEIIPAGPEAEAAAAQNTLLDTEVVRQIGSKLGADYVVWGILDLTGRPYRLEARLLQLFTEEAPAVFTKQVEDIELLFGSVRDLSVDIAAAVFGRFRITDVVVKGNARIESDAVKRVITSSKGDIFSAERLSRDLKSVYEMGYFDDVRIEAEDVPGGKRVVFHVEEKPTVREISVSGNKAVETDEIMKNITITTGSILNILRVQENIRSIESLYKEKNYHNVKITYTTTELENNQADLTFVIEEGERQQIKEITIEGNVDYSDKDLKSLMDTSEKGFFSWITSSGTYNPDDLSRDVDKLTAFYLNNGYIQARVSDPIVTFDGDWIYITIKIFEGPRFKVGNVSIGGDIITSEEELLDVTRIGEQEYFNRQVIQEDISALTEIYANEGYAFPDIAPLLEQDEIKQEVNITYEIDKGKQVYFEEISIRGNTKTRDKVIRRELVVYEGDLYSGERLKRSVRNLYRLDYFEDVKVNPVKGSADDKMILDIDVEEKPTGTFSFGAGYSSVENVFAMVQLSQRNLFGRGQKLQLKAQVGGTTTRYSLGFTEPWLFDIPLSAGFDLYNWIVDYDDYDRDSIGGGIRFGYPVYDYTRAYFGYSYDVSDINNIDPDAAFEIKDLEGENTTSSVSTSLRYDSRDRVFNPTEGSNHSIGLEYAGLGGNIGFVKYTAETGWYFPLIKDLVLFTHGEAGYIQEVSGKKVPDYERFYLGGMNSIRGFDWRDISVLNEDGNEIGGDKYVQFNVELIYPIFKEAGFVSVLFFDTGNVFGTSDSIDFGDLRESVGFGFRWYSPMGPLRIEYGRVLDAREGEDDGRWEFSVGQAF